MRENVTLTADRLLAERYGRSDPGTEITYAEIETAFGVRHPTNRFFRCMNKFRRTLLQVFDRATEVIPKSGLRVLPAADHVHVAAKQTRKALRSVKRGLVVLQHTRMNELSTDQRTAHAEATTRMAGLVGVAKADRDQLQKLAVAANPALPSTATVLAKIG